MSMDHRLIEEFVPVRAVSYEATREKLLRKRDYHISMLHLWWARRPLAAARAAVYATMVPADGHLADPGQLERFMQALCHWSASGATSGEGFTTTGVLGAPVAEARAQVLAANGGEPPKILDCFAGAGAIPLEVSRLGGKPFAVELNPVAYLILLCTLVYPQTYGESLADDIDKWGTWLSERSNSDLQDIYPSVVERGDQGSFAGVAVGSGSIPVAYLWTRTVPCPNTARKPHDLHLVRQTWLVRKPGKGDKAGRFVALRPSVDRNSLTVSYDVVHATTVEKLGFDPEEGSQRGAATCRVCGAAVTADDVKQLGRDGKIGYHLMGAVTMQQGKRGKQYLGSSEAQGLVPARVALVERLRRLDEESGLKPPETPLPQKLTGGTCIPYGFKEVKSLFLDRQLVTLLTIAQNIRAAHQEMVEGGMDEERAKAVATFLAMALDRVTDRCSTLCHWDNTRESTASTFARQALPMVWDFSETNPLADSSASLKSAIQQVAKVARHCANTGEPAQVIRGSATDAVEGGPFDAVITDPPYYDNISYADLSDFYYAWLQCSIGNLYPEHLSGLVTPKRKEVVAVPYRFGGDVEKARASYDNMMAEAFSRRYDELKPGAPMVVVYAHKTYSGWATLVNALRRAGFVVVEAWPLDTEMPTRALAHGTASLASSIFLVTRKREESRTGDWTSEVHPEMLKIIADRLKKLPEMGVAGDDLVIAAIGAGMRAYTQFPRVELPNGEELSPERFLEEVQQEVISTIVQDAGVRNADPVTQFYVLGRFQFGTAWVDFDRVNTAAKVGVELSGPRSLLKGRNALLVQEKGRVRFRDFSERGGNASLGLPDENGNPKPLIDILHRLLFLAEREPSQVRGFLFDSRADADRLRQIAQALSGKALTRKGVGTSGREQTALQSLLTSWKLLVEDNLLRVAK